MKPKHPYTQVHRERLLSVESWLKSSKELVDVLKTLVPLVLQYWKVPETRNATGHHVSVFMMLSSYAAEAALKAVIVRNESAEIERRLNSGEHFNMIVPEGHNLDLLVRRAGIKWTPEAHGHLLARMSRSAVCQARYPAPLRPAGFEMHDPLGIANDNYLPMSVYAESDMSRINDFIAMIWKELQN